MTRSAELHSSPNAGGAVQPNGLFIEPAYSPCAVVRSPASLVLGRVARAGNNEQREAMPDNSASREPRTLSLRHVAVQRALGLTVMASEWDEEGRPVPAKVYPAPAEAPGWVVEPPALLDPASGDCRTFTGSAALLQALEYAHRTYGSALYLSR